MSSNIQRLGNTLASRMKSTASAAVPTTLELGTIRDNLSLTTDSLRSLIPRGEYMVDRRLTGDSHTSTEGEAEPHSHELPDTFYRLKDGDRVLVAWCGNEPVVLAVVVSS